MIIIIVIVQWQKCEMSAGSLYVLAGFVAAVGHLDYSTIKA